VRDRLECGPQVASKQSGVVRESQPWHCYFHPSEENGGTCSKTLQNMEFSQININLEFKLELKISSYTGLIASPLYRFLI